jgi:hypothetical protein
MTPLTTAERHVIKHSLGLLRAKEPYRNRFVSDPETSDWPILQALCERGLMVGRRYPLDEVGESWVFIVTEAGRAALAEDMPDTGGAGA